MALFKRNSADIFAGKKDEDAEMPEYRVAAWASFDLKQHMREQPFTIVVPEDIEWTVDKVGEDLYEASGVLKLPIQMRLLLDRESGELIKQRVVLNGEKRFDVRDNDDKPFDPLASVNVDEARAQAFSQYSKSIKS